MDRQIVYSGQVPQTTDLLNTNRQTMIALAKLCADLFGTSTVVSGLNCVPTSPASMSVNITPGQIYQQANLDGTPYSALPQDTTHSLLKQGILMDAQSFTLTAPTTTGYSQNYLIQAAYLDNDIGNVVLPYYNSANPSQAFNGPGGSGAAQPTTRAGQVSLQLVAGTAAPTNTQVTPAVTAGYVGLAVITVANGQSTVTNAGIVPYPNVPKAPGAGFLAAVGERFSSIQNLAVSTGLTTAALGALMNVTASGQTITLPPAANCPNGTSVCVAYMQASGSTTVTRNGTDTLAFGQGNGANSLVLNPGEAVQFVSNGLNGWVSAGQTLTTGVTPPQFDNSNKLATTAFVQGVGLSAVLNAVSASVVLTAANMGQSIVTFQQSAITITLPSVASAPPGSRLEFFNYGSGGAVTIQVAAGSGDKLVTGMANLSTMTVDYGDTLVLESLGNLNVWYVVGGSAQLPYASTMSGAHWTTPAQFDNSAKLATTAFVQRVGKQLSGVTPFTGSLTGIAAHVGGKVYGYSTSFNSYSIPGSATYSIPIGAVVTVANFGSQPLTVVPQSTDKLQTPSSGLLATFVVPAGTSAEFTYVYSGVWFITGTAVNSSSSDFGRSLQASGYQKLPSGLIVQWGAISVPVSNGTSPSTVDGVFPLAFPGACAIFLASAAGYTLSPNANAFISGAPLSFSTYRIQNNYTPSAIGANWLALGW
ncbi:gp53-like domain-containing protein [Ralstonia sp. 24A2]|uniref:gp53-like domain-containing protein n=1 Tax=Ralstonia sp. 24A2 TaxID=3447364 RepID=UPI003F6980D5